MLIVVVGERVNEGDRLGERAEFPFAEPLPEPLRLVPVFVAERNGRGICEGIL